MKGTPLDLPPTLHGQLYLLSYNLTARRFDVYNESLFGLGLRAAMLTDLYLAGYLHDRNGRPHPTSTVAPHDPVLRAVWERVRVSPTASWSELIAEKSHRAPTIVCDQLHAGGWLEVHRRSILWLIPAKVTLNDSDAVAILSERVTRALHNAINNFDAEPGPLALGLLGVLAQMPTVLSFEETSRYRQHLRHMTLAAIEPILALHKAILDHLGDTRRTMSTI